MRNPICSIRINSIYFWWYYKNTYFRITWWIRMHKYISCIYNCSHPSSIYIISWIWMVITIRKCRFTSFHNSCSTIYKSLRFCKTFFSCNKYKIFPGIFNFSLYCWNFTIIKNCVKFDSFICYWGCSMCI